MPEINLNELAKLPAYEATVSSVAEKDADAERHIRLVSFYALIGATGLVLIICLAVFLLSADSGKQAWAQNVLQTLFPAAAAYVIGVQSGRRSER
jgi:hypothetical protein